MEEKRVPELRFAGFEREWEEVKLGEIAAFSKGKGISKGDISEGGVLECIRYGELYTHYGETISDVISKTNVAARSLVLSEANDVIIPASGESQIDIAKASCVLRSGVALGGDLNIIKTRNNGVFLSYYINSSKKYDIASLAQGISVVHLYPSQLSLLELNLPSLPEQQKIAAFFTAIDQKLQALRKQKALLEAYKRGVMQQIFSGVLRFKDRAGKEFGAWEEKRLGEVTEKFSVRNKNLIAAPVYSVTNSNGFVLQTNQFEGRIIAGNDLTAYKIVEKSDFAYNPARINVGSIAYFDNEIGIISSLYVCFRTKPQLLSDQFLLQFLQLDSTKQSVNDYGEGGVRIYLWYYLFAEIPIMLPSLPEQIKIAAFLSALDDKLAHCTRRLAATEVWKKGLMQRMFV